MIYLTKKDQEKTRFAMNHRMIERMEGAFDTILVLENGKKIIVDETKDEIINKIIEFESKLHLFQKKEQGTSEKN